MRKSLKIYIEGNSCACTRKGGHKDIVFLNQNGRQLTRAMIFTIVRKVAENAGVQKD